jgi:integrase
LFREPKKRADFDKRTVSDIRTFAGWDYILDIIHRIRERHGLQKAAYYASLIAGGWRASEVCRHQVNDGPDGKFVYGLRREHVQVKEDEGLLIFQSVPLLKKYYRLNPQYLLLTNEEHGRLPEDIQDKFSYIESKDVWLRKVYDTERKIERRTAAAPLSEKTSHIILEYLNSSTSSDFLFPFNRYVAYGTLIDVEPNVWLHWFRSQRASQLSVEYGWDKSQIKQWFDWQDDRTAEYYARMGYKQTAAWFPRNVLFPMVRQDG